MIPEKLEEGWEEKKGAEKGPINCLGDNFVKEPHVCNKKLLIF